MTNTFDLQKSNEAKLYLLRSHRHLIKQPELIFACSEFQRACHAPHVMGRVPGGELHRPVCYITHHAVFSAAKAQVVVISTSQQVRNIKGTTHRWFPGPELDLLNSFIGQSLLSLIIVHTFRNLYTIPSF